MRGNICWSIWAILLPFFFGCASAPKPVIIQHERTPSQSDAALPREQPQKEPADQKIAAMAELLEKKNAMDSGETALVTGQTETAATADKKAANAADINAQLTEIKKEIEEQVRNDVMNELLREVWKINSAMAEKDKRFRFSGDIRLRYEKDLYDSNNAAFAQPANPSELMNTTVDSDRFKYRVRFGVEAMVNERMDAVIRLSTGNTANPVSTNVTIGNYMNKDAVVFDLAYLKWQPWKSISWFGGRMPNPFFSSDLVWAKDLSFDGLVLHGRAPNEETWTPFFTAGAFPLQQNDFTAHQKWLAAGQLGLERKSSKGVAFRIGSAYYDFENITGVLNNPDNPGATNWTAPLYQQKGNTLFNISSDPTIYLTALAAKYKELNFTGTLDIGFWDPVHIVFLGDYVKNLGFNSAEVAQNTGNPDPSKEIEGYQYGLSVGYPATYAAGQWKVYFYKKRLESDAVVDAFTDPDFHLGGTNAQGWIMGTDLGLAKNNWLTIRWLTADQISGPPLAIDVLQVDFNARF